MLKYGKYDFKVAVVTSSILTIIAGPIEAVYLHGTLLSVAKFFFIQLLTGVLVEIFWGSRYRRYQEVLRKLDNR